MIRSDGLRLEVEQVASGSAARLDDACRAGGLNGCAEFEELPTANNVFPSEYKLPIEPVCEVPPLEKVPARTSDDVVVNVPRGLPELLGKRAIGGIVFGAHGAARSSVAAPVCAWDQAERVERAEPE